MATGFLSRESWGKGHLGGGGMEDLVVRTRYKLVSWSQMQVFTKKKMSNFVRKNGKRRLFKKKRFLSIWYIKSNKK